MNWHYDNPVVNGEYLCWVRGYSSPISLDWDNGEWGRWTQNKEFYPLDNLVVVCHISFNEIPKPENW